MYASGPRAASTELVSSLQIQVEQLRRELYERDVRLATLQSPPSRAENQPPSTGLLLYILVLGILAVTVVIAFLLLQESQRGLGRRFFAARNAEFQSPTTAPSPETLPLDAIFRLEDELSMLAMSAHKTYRLLEADEKPKIPSPTGFLRTLNSVRRQLEGLQTAGDDIAYSDSLRDFNFREEAKSYDFYEVNKALSELDDTLSSRYDSKEKEWRPRALAALARARRALIAVCEPIAESDASATVDSAA